MKAAGEFDLRQYIHGRVPLPPWVYGKKQRPFGFTANASIANGNVGNLTFNIHDDAYFLVEAIQGITSLQTASQDLVTVQFTDTSSSQSWSNVAANWRDAVGTGYSPKYLSDPNILRPSSTLVAQITNNSGSTVQAYMLLMGRKIYGLSEAEAAILSRRMWFQYILDAATIAGSTNNASRDLQFFNESDFIVKKLLSQSLVNAVIGAALGSESAEVECNFRNTTTDENLFDDFVPARLIFGAHQMNNPVAAQAAWTNGSPFCLKKPWTIRRNSRLAGLFNNLSTDATGAFQIVFEGIRTFDAK